MWRKQSKIGARLGLHWQRPKGMKLKAYDLLMQVLLTYEERREEAFAGFLLFTGKWLAEVEDPLTVDTAR